MLTPSSLICPSGFTTIDNKHFICKPEINSPSTLACENGYMFLDSTHIACNPLTTAPSTLHCPNGLMSVPDPNSMISQYYACKPLLTPSTYHCHDEGIEFDKNHYACKSKKDILDCKNGISYISKDQIQCK
jgi:hypothetical protein